jgi:hypothetical protein
MLALLSLLLASTASADTLSNVVAANGLTVMSYNFPVPNQVFGSNKTYSYIQDNWNLVGKKVDFGTGDL